MEKRIKPHEKRPVLNYLIVLTVLFTLLSCDNVVPTTTYIRQWGGPEVDAVGSIAIDHDGKVIVTGMYGIPSSGEDMCVFPDRKTSITTYSNILELLWEKQYETFSYEWALSTTLSYKDFLFMAGTTYSTIFLAKYTNDGHLLWQKTTDDLSGNYMLSMVDMLIDEFGNTVILGHMSPNYKSNYVLIKYDKEGNLLWSVQSTPGIEMVATALARGKNEGIFIAGRAETYPLPTDGTTERYLFVSQYNSDGERVWEKKWDKGNTKYASGGAVDENNNFFVTGYVYDETGKVSDKNMFLAKFDSSGETLWVKQWEKPYNNSGNDIVIHNGALFITGGTAGKFGNVYFGGSDVFLAKYTLDGEKEWIQQWGTVHSDTGIALAIDDDNSIFIVGATNGDFAAENQGFSDMFLLKYQNIEQP